jgi:hypothetical protein
MTVRKSKGNFSYEGKAQDYNKGEERVSKSRQSTILSQTSDQQRLNDLYEMLCSSNLSTIFDARGNSTGVGCDDMTGVVMGMLYQRLLPPRGAALEEVKPPNNVLVSPIS